MSGPPPRDEGVGRRFRLTIPTQIFLGFTLVVVLFASVLAFNVTRLNRLYEEVTALSRGLFPLRVAQSEIAADLRSYAGLLSERDPVALRDAVLASRVLSPFERRIEGRLEGAIATLDELALREGNVPVGLRRVRGALTSLQEQNEELGRLGEELEGVLEGETFEGLDEARRALFAHIGPMERQVLSVSVTTDSVVTAALDWARQQREGSIVMVAVTTAGAILVALVVMLWAARTLRPLTRLTEGVKTLRGGTYETVTVGARNEIGDLAEEFNQMVRALEERDAALERAYQTAIEAERLAAMGRLTSQITHEIRNPLSSIGLNIELLEEEIAARGSGEGGRQADVPSGGGDRDESVALIRAIHEEIDRLTAITDEYLQFARLPEPKPALVEVNELLQEVVSFHGGELGRAGVEVVLELAEALPTVEADAGQLRQAVLNLVKNAREAMPLGGRIELSTARRGEAVEIAIADEGDGVEEEARERIFDPFFTTKSQGTGLGLPLTKRIVDRHGGAITCKARAGGGTTFVLRFPRRLEEGTASGGGGASPPDGTA